MKLADHLCANYIERHPRDAARVMEELGEEKVVEYLRTLSPNRAARTLIHTDRRICRLCLVRLDDVAAAQALVDFPLDQAASVLREMEGDHAKRLLHRMPTARRRSLDLLLRYPRNTAGYVMDPLFPSLIDDVTVGEAVKLLRAEVRRASLCVYVTNSEKKLLGQLDLRRLLDADAEDRIAPMIDTQAVSISALTDIASLLAHPEIRSYGSLPVVTENLTYIGAVRGESLEAYDPEMQREVALNHARQTGAALGELFRLGFGGLVQSADSTTIQRTPVRGRKEDGS